MSMTFAYGHAMMGARHDESATGPIAAAINWFGWSLLLANIDNVGGNSASSIARLIWASIRDSASVPDDTKSYVWIWLLVPVLSAILFTISELHMVQMMAKTDDKEEVMLPKKKGKGSQRA